MTSTNIDTGAILVAILAAFASVLSQNPFDIDINKAKGILIFIGILVFIWGAGYYFFNRWDMLTQTELIYLRSLKREEMKEDEDGYKFDLMSMFLLNNLQDKAYFTLGGRQGIHDLRREREEEAFKKEMFNIDVFHDTDNAKAIDVTKALPPKPEKLTVDECKVRSNKFFKKILPPTMMRDHDTTFQVTQVFFNLYSFFIAFIDCIMNLLVNF